MKAAFGEGDTTDLLVYIQLSLAEDGKMIFNSLEGRHSGWRKIDQIGVIVTTDSSAYFQMYYIPALDAFIGNYYERIGQEQLTIPKGTVRLDRES